MTTSGSPFEIEKTATHRYWAELDGGQVIIHRDSVSGDPYDEVLLRWDVDVLRNLLIWADQDGPVTASLTGPLAHQIRKHAEELGMTPEMFVWHAVKVFIEVGADS